MDISSAKKKNCHRLLWKRDIIFLFSFKKWSSVFFRWSFSPLRKTTRKNRFFLDMHGAYMDKLKNLSNLFHICSSFGIWNRLLSFESLLYMQIHHMITSHDAKGAVLWCKIWSMEFGAGVQIPVWITDFFWHLCTISELPSVWSHHGGRFPYLCK